MKKTPLSVIANIQCGLVLNRKEARTAETVSKPYKRLNLRSLKEDGSLNIKELDDFDSIEYLNEQFLTQRDDIIIRLFAPLSPVRIQDGETGFVIPSQLAVIRIKDERSVLPGYLRWYLSSPEVSGKLLLAENSLKERSIKVGKLSALPVPILPPEKQELIIQICETAMRREKLYKELLNQETVYMNGFLQRVIREAAK